MEQHDPRPTPPPPAEAAKPKPNPLLIVVALVGIFFGARQCMSGMGLFSGKQKQEVGPAVVFDATGVTMRMPAGWEQTPNSSGGVAYVAPKSSGYNANIIVLGESFAGPMKDYVGETILKLTDGIPNLKIQGPSGLTTNDGTQAVKLTLENPHEKGILTQDMFIIEGAPPLKVIVTCTVPQGDHAALAPLFEACFKTITPVAGR